jgi:hypothetical protein
MFNYIPEFFAPRRPTRGGGRRWYDRQEEQPANARPAAARRGRPRHQLRGQGRPGHTARRRVPRHRLAATPSTSSAAAVHVPPVQGAGRRRHHQGADGSRADLPLRDGRRPRRRRHHRESTGRPGCSPPAKSPAACTAPTAWAATRSPTCSCSAGAPACTPHAHTRSASRSPAVDDGQVEGHRREMLAPFEKQGGENPYTIQKDLQDDACTIWSASSATSRS